MTVKDFDLNNFTRLERVQFTLSGLYPLKNPTRLQTLVHHLKYTLLILFSTILCMSMTIAIALGVDNLDEITEILYYLITQSAYVLKLFNFTVQRSKMHQLEAHVRHPISYKYYAIYGTRNLESIVRICRYTGNYFRICVTVVLVFYILVPLIDPQILLPFAGWMPVDKVKYRAIIFTIQITCFVISAYTNSSMDIFTAYYISVGVGQLRLLKQCLENVDYTNHSQRVVVGKDGKLPASALQELVVLHKHAITLVNMIEDIFSYGIFIQFLASVVVICMTGFQMLVVSLFSAEFVLLFFYFTCMMCQVVLYCWYGNEIMFESSELGQACYMSNWYEATPVQKKVLFIMMERSKREIVLTVGKFFNLTLTTLVLIVKSSYSYFAVLRRMYNE